MVSVSNKVLYHVNVMHAQLVEFMSFHDIIKAIIKQKTTEENIFYICACTHMDF